MGRDSNGRNARGAKDDVGNQLFNFYEAADGKWLQLVMIESERFWNGFCQAFDLEDLTNDPRFVSHADRMQNNKALLEIIEDRFSLESFVHWSAKINEQRCIWAPVQTIDQVDDDLQVLANGYTTTLTHGYEGDFRILTPPLRWDRTPGALTATAPELGEDTETSLLELGYNWDDVVALKEQGAII